MTLDLNCDLGEGEPPRRIRQLMRWITSANVACGGHGGDVRTMETCARLARKFHVRLGAHPGPWDREGFGRGTIRISAAELELLLLHQVGALQRIAQRQNIDLHHVKLHGALYHATETDPSLAKAYLRTVARWWPGLKVYVRAGGMVESLALKAGVSVWPEAFADRGYNDDGTLIPRKSPGALLTKPAEVLDRLQLLVESSQITSITGGQIHLRARTVCVHSDTPGAPKLARRVKSVLEKFQS